MKTNHGPRQMQVRSTIKFPLFYDQPVRKNLDAMLQLIRSHKGWGVEYLGHDLGLNTHNGYPGEVARPVHYPNVPTQPTEPDQFFRSQHGLYTIFETDFLPPGENKVQPYPMVVCLEGYLSANVFGYAWYVWGCIPYGRYEGMLREGSATPQMIVITEGE